MLQYVAHHHNWSVEHLFEVYAFLLTQCRPNQNVHPIRNPTEYKLDRPKMIISVKKWLKPEEDNTKDHRLEHRKEPPILL